MQCKTLPWTDNTVSLSPHKCTVHTVTVSQGLLPSAEIVTLWKVLTVINLYPLWGQWGRQWCQWWRQIPRCVSVFQNVTVVTAAASAAAYGSGAPWLILKTIRKNVAWELSPCGGGEGCGWSLWIGGGVYTSEIDRLSWGWLRGCGL